MKKYFVLVLFLLLIMGCGGGGSSNSLDDLSGTWTGEVYEEAQGKWVLMPTVAHVTHTGSIVQGTLTYEGYADDYFNCTLNGDRLYGYVTATGYGNVPVEGSASANMIFLEGSFEGIYGTITLSR